MAGMIEKSPESARIILVGSNEAFTDQTLQLSRAANNDRFVNSLQFLENVVDWALEDRALLSIRSRAHFARTLVPMTREQKAFWEYLNYGIVLVGLALIYAAHRYHLRRLRDRYHTMLAALERAAGSGKGFRTEGFPREPIGQALVAVVGAAGGSGGLGQLPGR